jgi:thiol-disulfide isomerase/thioredoxin
MSRFTLLLILLVGGMLALACSGGGTPTAPSNLPDVTNAQAGNPETHVALGTFDLNLNAADGTAEIVNGRIAENHFNVKSLLTPPGCTTCFNILGTFYDAGSLTFWVDVAVVNPFPITIYDLRTVISNPGGQKYLINPDGVTTVWGSPMQYKAYNQTGDRAFGDYAAYGQTFQFSLPPGEGFQTFNFLIDVSFPGVVEEPLIENCSAPSLVNNGLSVSRLTANLFDHQWDINPATVFADMMSLGGNPQTMLYDDGMHGDGGAADGVFCSDEFTTEAALGFYMLNVYATDNLGHMGWGQCPLSVQQSTGGPNDDPVINGVTTDKTTAQIGGTDKIKVTVNAVDPNGDTLGYEFDPSTGSMSGASGNFAYWKPASGQTGMQTIAITVNDDKGGSAESEIHVWATTKSIIKSPIPAGTVTSIIPNATLHMNEDFMGKVLYINVWATWCGPCTGELPELSAMCDHYASQPDYNHMELNNAESSDTVSSFVNQNGYHATYWCVDPNGAYDSKLLPYVDNYNAIPQHYIFDRDGNCRYAAVGSVSSTAPMEAIIDELL